MQEKGGDPPKCVLFKSMDAVTTEAQYSSRDMIQVEAFLGAVNKTKVMQRSFKHISNLQEVVKKQL